MNDFNFKNKLSKEIENSNLISNNNDDNNDEEQKDHVFCNKVILGKLPLGYYDENIKNNKDELFSCSKLYCNKCDHKITYIADNKFNEQMKQNRAVIMKECLEQNNNFNSYSCKCSHISLNENKSISELGFDWECDGHYI